MQIQVQRTKKEKKKKNVTSRHDDDQTTDVKFLSFMNTVN